MKILSGALAALLAFSAVPALAGPPVTTRELLEVRDLSGLVVSPDGRLAAVRVHHLEADRNSADLSWWVVPLDGSGGPRRVASGGQPVWQVMAPLKDEVPQWSSDSAWIYYRAMDRGEVQLWRTRADGAVTQRLTEDAADILAFHVDPAGGRLLYQVGASRETILRAEAEEYRSGMVVDETTPTTGRIANNTPWNGRLATVRRGASGRSLLGDTAPRVRVLDLAQGTMADGSEADRHAFDRLSARPPVRSLDGRVATLTRLDTPVPAATPEEQVISRLQARAQFRVSVDGKACEAAPCAGLGAQIGRLAWRPGGREVLFGRLGDEGSTETTLWAWDVRTGRVRSVFSGGFFGAARRGIGDCPVAGDRMICVTSAAASAPRLESIDLANGARRVLFDPNPHMRDGRFGPTEGLSWRDEKGRGFHGQLLLPPGHRPGTRLPLVITTYACAGFLRGGVGDEYPEHVFAAEGFAVLCYDHDTRDTARTVQKGPDGKWLPVPGMQMATEALEAAIDLLDRRGLVDPNRVGVSGLSYGARTTLYAISHSDRFAAASTSSASDLDPADDHTRVLGGPISDGIRTLEGLPPMWADPDGVRARVSPALNASRIGAPLLIQVADNEYAGDTIEFMAHMKRANKPLEVVIFPDETHQKWQPVHKLAAYNRNLDWFRFWLQGREDPDPTKAAQYARWRKLRDLKATR